MKKMIIFDPAMCCSTGVCGPSVNPELLRVATTNNVLKNKGVIIERYNLSQNPQAFIDNKTISDILNSNGVKVLPVTMVDGTVIKTGDYPTMSEFQAHCETLDEAESGTCCDTSEGCCVVDEEIGVEVESKTKGPCCDGNTGCC